MAMMGARLSLALGAGLSTLLAALPAAEAKSCAQLRALCWTMRDDKSDCTRPYQRCLETGLFVTPLGRRFQATSR